MRDADGYCRWLGSYFYAEGYDRDDICQEAMLAAWLAPSGLERVAARRRVLDILKAARRRPRFVELVEVETPDNVVDAVDARDRLRAVLAAARTENERVAIARVMRGEPIARDEKALQVALWRLRRKVAA